MQGFLDGHIRGVHQILQLDFCGDCALFEGLQLTGLTKCANQTFMKTVYNVHTSGKSVWKALTVLQTGLAVIRRACEPTMCGLLIRPATNHLH